MSRRELGSYYTPQGLAESIVAGALGAFAGRGGDPCQARLLDPACGAGALLLAGCDWLFDIARRRSQPFTSRERVDIVERCLFGVDLDPQAVANLRQKLLERTGAKGALAVRAAKALDANLRVGCALSGRAFATTGLDLLPDVEGGIDWAGEFPAAARVGGFDIVVGNPPYRRERAGKALFDRLASTELGRRWRQGRMDLWYYFLHRSLDLMRSGGVLSFIVNSYWTASRGASRLIDRLASQTRFEEIVLLGNSRVFDGVSGRHMVFRLTKLATARETGSSSAFLNRGHTHSADPVGADPVCRIVVAGESGEALSPDARQDSKDGHYELRHSEIFRSGRMVLARSDELRGLQQSIALESQFETRQGIAENPPAINARLAREFGPGLRVGEGVFVLAAHELERLELNPRERALLRPYYRAARLLRYNVPREPCGHLLYLTRLTAPALDGLPGVAAHLERFRPILERRREARLGRIAWWHLHWPRDERVFLEPRILSVQMGPVPQFALAVQPTFVGFSVNVILARPGTGISLAAACGILNSQLAASWFARHAKRRGAGLEINAHVLRRFPLPARDPEIEGQLERRVLERHPLVADSSEACAAEQAIEALVERLYGRRP